MEDQFSFWHLSGVNSFLYSPVLGWKRMMVCRYYSYLSMASVRIEFCESIWVFDIVGGDLGLISSCKRGLSLSGGLDGVTFLKRKLV